VGASAVPEDQLLLQRTAQNWNPIKINILNRFGVIFSSKKIKSDVDEDEVAICSFVHRVSAAVQRWWIWTASRVQNDAPTANLK